MSGAGAGVSRPLLCRRFRDKQHAFEDLVDQLVIAWNETLVDAVSRGTAAPRGVLSASTEPPCKR